MNNKFWWYALSCHFLEHWFVLPILIPKAFKKATKSLEKLIDVMKEELLDIMIVVRLSGMKISDLTIVLSDLGFASRFQLVLANHMFLFLFGLFYDAFGCLCRQ